MCCEKASSVVIPGTLLLREGDGAPAEMSLEEYVKGSLPAYLPEGAPPAALKALSIAIRSCAAVSRQHAREGFDVCTSGDCPAWQPAGRSAATDRAVDETAGQVLVVPGGGGGAEQTGKTQVFRAAHAVTAPFFNKCDGRTRSSQEVWHIPLGHCRGVACACGNTELQGHGVGLCLAGALAMARQGAPAADILEHYYTGTRVVAATAVARNRLCQALIVGRVVDSAGRSRSGVTLILSGPAGQYERSVSADGRFWFSGLPAGDWDLKVKGSSLRRPGLHTDGRGTLDTQITVPGLPLLTMDAMPVAHPRVLIGTLGYDGVPVTIAGSTGVQATVESGSAPEFDPGGFSVPLPPAGACTLSILGQSFSVQIGDTGLWLRFSAQVATDPS